MKKIIFIFSIIFLISCSSTKLRKGTIPKLDSEKLSNSNITVSLSYKVAENSYNKNIDHYKYWFEYGLIYGKEYPDKGGSARLIIDNENKSACQIQVEYFDDSDSFKSWKTWVSGLSLFIVPVKLYTSLNISIEKNKAFKRNYELETWRSILLLPVAIFVFDREEVISRIGNEVYINALKVCYEG
jgi:hypothetical protein